MDVRVKFLGGAQTVTGSRYLLEIDDTTILVDCGLFQGVKEIRKRNWDEFPIDPKSIDIVLLTHAHIDHSGYLPKLVKEGFKGQIILTKPSLDLVKILLMDSGKLQEEEAEYARKKGYSRHEKPEPLYTVEDAENVFGQLQPIEFDEEVSLTGNVSLTAYNAGHILGAASLKLKLHGDTQRKTIVFSGDIGRYNDPILNPPIGIPKADILFIESTYGNRLHVEGSPELTLAAAINDTYQKGGVSVIPSFAVGRTQLILYYLFKLQQKGKIPQIPIYVDSPMAIDVTKLYKDYIHYHRLGPSLQEENSNPFAHKNLHYYQSQESSMSLNHFSGDAIIISASGMATGGRIVHHLYNRLPNEKDSFIFVGYQAEGTRGRKLLDGNKYSHMYGLDVEVRASIYYIEGLSAHADESELLKWTDCIAEKPKMTFVIHGEKESAEAFATTLHENYGWNTLVPDYLESFEIFKGI
ncbi:MBL fold metallo-hydrolase [Echinicola marina]|uniref:MBL fold metallo-hydrolase RNA specificity domain-containing protein n=1 Tax=Echinicola marina TaxID=2859768 RepID=UPI001CF695DA|nr:MBL fold metallo-hydrolase [Echinicola marina]UCS93792.1 MBL fold metallo-hydrolase [Echinicola marina]